MRKTPVDVVIPAHRKDLPTLKYCIRSAKKYVRNVRRIIVISKTKLTDEAEWFDESKFSFSKQQIEKTAKKIGKYGTGWYYQQLLKLYALSTIPRLTDNILILDADAVFFRKTDFIDSKGRFFLDLAKEKDIKTQVFCKSARKFIKTMLPNLDLSVIKRRPNWISGVSHHMLFNKKIMKDLFDRVRKIHRKKNFWKIFLDTAQKRGCNCASEYDLYFIFALNFYREKVKLRKLKYKNTHDINFWKYIGECLRKKYDYCAYHNRDYQMKD